MAAAMRHQCQLRSPPLALVALLFISPAVLFRGHLVRFSRDGVHEFVCHCGPFTCSQPKGALWLRWPLPRSLAVQYRTDPPGTSGPRLVRRVAARSCAI